MYVDKTRHDFAMKHMSATLAVMGGILTILILSEILPVYLVDRLYLSVAVTGNKYCIFVRVQGAVEN